MEFLTDDFDNMSSLPPLSEMSIGTETYSNDSHNNNQIGGFFWSSRNRGNNSNKVDQAVLKAMKSNNTQAVEFMVNSDLVSDYCARDENGKTLLHYMASRNMTGGALEKILSRADVKSFINIKSNDGNAPLHVAVQNGGHQFAEKLIEAGADKKIVNKEGLRVETETENIAEYLELPVSRSTHRNMTGGGCDDLEIEECPMGGNHNLQIVDNSGGMYWHYQCTKCGARCSRNLMNGGGDSFFDKFQDRINNIVGSMVGRSDNPQQDSELTYNDAQLASVSEANTVAQTQNTDGFLDMLVDKYDNSDLNVESTEAFIDRLTNKYGGQAGGQRGQTGGQTGGLSGRRKLKTYVESGQLGDSDSSDNDSSDVNESYEDTDTPGTQLSRSDELSRLIKNQSNEIHERVLEKIKKLLKELFPKKEFDDDTVRNYKAVLWNIVTTKHKDIESNLDKSIKLEDLTTKANIKKIDPKKGEKLREASRKNREKRITERKEKQGESEKSSEISATSSEAVGDVAESALSATSFSNGSEFKLSSTSADYQYGGNVTALSATSFSNGSEFKLSSTSADYQYGGNVTAFSATSEF
jgi:hypothetical protein